MKRTLLVLAAMAGFGAMAQQQLPNSDMEQWENVGAPEEEPLNWSSLKTADALTAVAPEVLSQDVGRGGTGFSAMLEVVEVFSIPANGIMTNGRVHADFNPELGYVYTDSTDAQWHTVFTDRPDSIVGWFKHEETSADPGKVEIIFHELNAQLPEASANPNVIGRARYNPSGNVTTWTRFSAPVIWLDGRTPRFALVVINCGDSTISQTGTKMWIDDLELIYNPVGLDENADRYNVWSDLGVVYVDLLEKSAATGVKTFELIDLQGKVVYSEALQNGKRNEFRPGVGTGVYVTRISSSQGSVSQRVFIK